MPPTKDKIIIEKKSIELEEDPEECKKVLSFLQWKFERKFDKPSSPSVKPKKEHFFAFYNFYDECLRSSENNFEKKQQIGLILRTFVTVSNDNFNKFYQEMPI